VTAPRHLSRFLLARPRGGLNDTLCQIELCLRHAETFDRTLMLDLSHSKGCLDFDTYFRWNSPMVNVQVDVTPNQIAMLNLLPCRPAEVTGRLADYRNRTARPSGGRVVNCLEGTTIPLSSDLSRDYPEPVLLHDAWGGGDASKSFLQRVTLEPGLAREIASTILPLGSDYAAIHVRHTDFRTEDWRSFLKSIRGGLRGRTVLMCSDNAEVIEGARMILKDAHVRTVTEISRGDGRPLHFWPDADQATVVQVHHKAFIDLFSLAAAADLYRTVESHLHMSGFSRLAGALCEDRTLLASLLGEATSSISTVPGRVHHVIPWKTKALMLPRRMREKLRHLGRAAATVLGLR
jgi:hypothetical protein